MDPFLAARNLRPDYSPVVTPEPHKQQFLKNVMFWLMDPLIRAGKVLVFPDPDEIDLEFQHTMREMALERTDNWHPEPNDLGNFTAWRRTATLALSVA